MLSLAGMTFTGITQGEITAAAQKLEPLKCRLLVGLHAIEMVRLTFMAPKMVAEHHIELVIDAHAALPCWMARDLGEFEILIQPAGPSHLFSFPPILYMLIYKKRRKIPMDKRVEIVGLVDEKI